MSPCQIVNERCFVCLFFARYFGRLFCFGYLGLNTPQIIVGKKQQCKARPSSTGRQGLNRMRLQNFRIYLPKTAWRFGLFWRKKCENRLVTFNYLLTVSVFDQLWAIIVTLYWPYAVRSSNICAKRFVGVPWGTWNGLLKKMVASDENA